MGQRSPPHGGVGGLVEYVPDGVHGAGDSLHLNPDRTPARPSEVYVAVLFLPSLIRLPVGFVVKIPSFPGNSPGSLSAGSERRLLR